jgi:hypothetical protein
VASSWRGMWSAIRQTRMDCTPEGNSIMTRQF